MKVFFFIAALSFIISCNNDANDYESLMAKEVSSGKRADSLFFGIYLGMTSKQFFTQCWQLNKQGIFTDGNNNTAVLYKLNKNELKYPASMNFYPEFRENKIYKMWATFQYDGWAPWNKHMYSDSLLPELLKLYKTWYSSGNPFIEMHDKERGTIYVKVDGNRRIIIGRYNDMIVKVDYADLLVDKQ
ncbi:hypothetical protein FRZ67_13145 [Panacibacter ginsenosidivorans]|uniref:Lipoprotein n=1 Tax=Panacibacter ginsenosidivorans TaxID=1813871 RepID=A0A5B8VBB0_9BACT|nr:hypothetical protein [Panacibacter ginsenosidivorans]QEC68201.1 hypothetical protein FRZ67_13145 [Panacibacter ginsenosidivorans]